MTELNHPALAAAAREVKLIATDVDGTLLPEGTRNLDPRLYELIRALKEKGIAFAIGTGRGYRSVRRLFDPVADDLLFMVQNGSFTMQKEQSLYTMTIDPSALEEIVSYVRAQKEEDVLFWMTAGMERQYTESKNEAFIRRLEEGYVVEYDRVDDVLAVEDPTLLKCAIYTSGDAAGLAAILNDRFGDRVNIAASGAHWIDCNPVAANKGEGLRRIQQYLGVTPEQTMAFGDNTNDVPMLLAAKWSFAVEEGREEARNAAAYSAGAMLDGGVTQVLEALLAELS